MALGPGKKHGRELLESFFFMLQMAFSSAVAHYADHAAVEVWWASFHHQERVVAVR
jgi:hypothetical protein